LYKGFIDSGVNTFKIEMSNDLRDLSNGIYFVRLQANNLAYIKTLILKR